MVEERTLTEKERQAFEKFKKNHFQNSPLADWCISDAELERMFLEGAEKAREDIKSEIAGFINALKKDIFGDFQKFLSKQKNILMEEAIKELTENPEEYISFMKESVEKEKEKLKKEIKKIIEKNFESLKMLALGFSDDNLRLLNEKEIDGVFSHIDDKMRHPSRKKGSLEDILGTYEY